MRPGWALGMAVVLASALAGCQDDAPTSLPAAEPAKRTWQQLDVPLGCSAFCEPNLAVDAQGRILAWSEGQLALSPDGGRTWETRQQPPPPLQAPPGAYQNDALVQAGPDGRFYFSALLTYFVPLVAGGALVLDGIQVA